MSPPAAPSEKAPPQTKPDDGPKPTDDFSAEALLAAFEGRIKRPRVSVFYQIGLLVVAILMVLLPLIYIALILCVIAAVAYHTVADYPMIVALHRTRGILLLAVVYATPIIVGSILIFFMLKPLLARAAVAAEGLELKRDRDPLLFSFVEKICEAVRAAKPRRIMLDCEVNASASFDRGLWSFVRGRLVLTVGLPLVVGLNTRELAGVLAHEFGHFSQGVAMRLSYVIHSINRWFARVVYERDSWDVWLARSSQEEDWKFQLIFGAARVMVWIVRKILWVLMMIGHIISCFMLRQMEYNADQYEIRLAGARSFISTARKLRILGVAWQAAIHALSRSWMERRLGDDVGTLVVARAREMPKDIRNAVEEAMQNDKTGLFDTHPSDRARIRKAEKAEAAGGFGTRIRKAEKTKASGVFRLEAPPWRLFRNYRRTARLASVAYYRSVLGPEFEPEALISTKELQEGHRKQREEGKALARYSQRLWSTLFLPTIEETRIPAPSNYQETAKKLAHARDQMETAIPTTRETYGLLEEEHGSLMSAKAALALVKAGFQIRPKDFSLESVDRDYVQSRVDRAQGSTDQYREQIANFNHWARIRLVCALQLLHHPKVREKLGARSIEIPEMEGLCAALAAVGGARSLVLTLHQNRAILSMLLSNYEGHEGQTTLEAEIRNVIAKCRRSLDRLFTTLDHHKYPFDHATGDISIGRYLAGDIARASGGEIVAKAGETLDAYYTLYFRLLGCLTHLAESIETAVGLKPWPEPPRDDGSDATE